MSRILRHKWIPQDGFNIDKCEHCGCIRKWDDGWKRTIYLTEKGSGVLLWAPSCKRVYFCDLITKN